MPVVEEPGMEQRLLTSVAPPPPEPGGARSLGVLGGGGGWRSSSPGEPVTQPSASRPLRVFSDRTTADVGKFQDLRQINVTGRVCLRFPPGEDSLGSEFGLVAGEMKTKQEPWNAWGRHL